MGENVQQVIQRLGMDPHVEGGAFLELYRDGAPRTKRAAHGVIYYALNADEHADFHKIDCDEYWLYHAGSTLEIWMLEPDGQLHIERMGIGEGDQPCVLVKAGVLFGARHLKGAKEPTLLSCVTVPEFTYDKYELYRKEEVVANWPQLAPFWQE